MSLASLIYLESLWSTRKHREELMIDSRTYLLRCTVFLHFRFWFTFQVRSILTQSFKWWAICKMSCKIFAGFLFDKFLNQITVVCHFRHANYSRATPLVKRKGVGKREEGENVRMNWIMWWETNSVLDYDLLFKNKLEVSAFFLKWERKFRPK